jgi:hypothetical protein
MAGAVRALGDAVRGGEGGGGADGRRRTESGSAGKCAPGAVVEADLQCLGHAVSALTRLPHSPEFADERSPDALGRLLHELIDEGKRVAQARGVALHEDPWEMNRIGAQTNHPTSMLFDVDHELPTEVDYLCGAHRARGGTRRHFGSAALRDVAIDQGMEVSWQLEKRKTATQRA